MYCVICERISEGIREKRICPLDMTERDTLRQFGEITSVGEKTHVVMFQTLGTPNPITDDRGETMG